MKKTLSFLFIVICVMTLFPHTSRAQELLPRPIVQLIYFYPRDRQPQPDIDEKIDGLIKDVQEFYAQQMENHGFGRKTFVFETDAQGKAVVHHVKGQFNHADYQNDFRKAWNEAMDGFPRLNRILLSLLDADYKGPCGRGGGNPFSYRLTARAAVSTGCFTVETIAHELGHAFGLHHDYREVGNWLPALGVRDPMITSFCAAEWLDVIPALNAPIRGNTGHTTVKMLTPSLVSPSNTLRLRFKVADPDGLHQVQWCTFEPWWKGQTSPALWDYEGLKGVSSSTVEFVTTAVKSENKALILRCIDAHGNLAGRGFPIVDISLLRRPPEVVSIPDANLAAVLREKIGESITTHGMLILGSLSLRNRGITDLTGLEHAHNLTRLSLGAEYIRGEGDVNNNAVSDFSPLSGLTQLTYLDLRDNTISDVASLTQLTQLRILNLNNNTIVDVAPLAQLTQLTRLLLNNNTIVDVAPLAQLTQLGDLFLDGNTIVDVAPLAQLTQLRILYLENNAISDVAPLAQLTQLRNLSLGGNAISDVAPLAQLTQLTFLYLRDNTIVDVVPLAQLTQLRNLYLENNAISDMSPLVELDLPGTQRNSTGLYLQGNPLNYASLHTHIPAMQAKGVEVKFDPRSPTTLVKTLGTAQQGIVNAALRLPLVVEVRDQQNRPFAGVPVTFAVTGGDGRLSATTTTTDADGRAKTHLTVGRAVGTITVRATAAEISQSVQFTATAVLPNSPVALPDPNLRAQVLQTLGKPRGGTPTMSDMLKLTALHANSANIRDLTGLQHATHLTTLSLNNNRLTDVTPLTGLPQLKILSLDDNNLSDVGSLALLTELETLSLNNNRLSDVAALSGLTLLKTLSLNNNTLSDVAPLTTLAQLKTLRLRGNPMSYPSLQTHIPALRASGTVVSVDSRTPTTLVNLSGTHGVAGETLSIIAEVRDEKGIGFRGVPVSFTVAAGGGSLSPSNVITDRSGRVRTSLTLGATPGKNIISVAAVEVSHPALFTITAIDVSSRVTIRDANLRGKIAETLGKSRGVPLTAGDMLTLRTLEARNAGIQNLSGLEYAHNLTKLDLDGEYISGEGYVNSNAVSDISPISGVTQLRTLKLTSNGITDVSPLAQLTQLTYLDLRDNTISDVASLTQLTQLTHLHLSGNTISDVAPLAQLTQLTGLGLRDNTISDVSPLTQLTQLTELWIHDNTISDVSPLAQLTQLTRLYLSGNTISDVSPLAQLTQLTQLYLSGNTISNVAPLVNLNLIGTSWNSTGLFLQQNPLNYTSLHTHIPAMQAKGVEVKFDPRTYPALDIISGTGQQAAGGEVLTNPFFVAAIDARGTPMSGVSVTFTVIEGNGELSTTNATTDARGRAQTTLTLGPNPGKNRVRATAAALQSSVPFISVTVEAPDPITEILTVLDSIPEDVNGDGAVDNEDLALVLSNAGQVGQNPADVNGDGKVDIGDVQLVLEALAAAPAAPALKQGDLKGLTAADVQALLTEARQFARTDTAYLRSVAVLAQLLAFLLPKETALLPNYPNPFNPETWIPYQLSKPAEVTLHIYSVKGELVRRLALGHQPAGMYRSKSRAAYWDGRNEQGEKVASGTYFYTLSARDFSATRKLLIQK